jgi:hypothetical protein
MTMRMLIYFLALPALIVALPSLRGRSVVRFLAGLFFSFFGIVLPLFVFVFSLFLIPDSKRNAPNGWLDCFYEGKLALTPLVMWAMAAFFAVNIYKTEDRKRKWIVQGHFIGAIVSSVCTLVGIYCTRKQPDWAYSAWMLVPIYVSVWYSFSAVGLIKEAQLQPKMYLKTLGGSLPLWIGSIWWSRTIYDALPDTTQGCFVVTAAARGHGRLVGPFFEITRQGCGRRANRQLLTFWQFEDAWQRHAPGSHAFFRRIYNCAGPMVARRLTRAWMADAVYLALKPVEFAAAIFIKVEWGIFKHEHAREVGSAGNQNANSGGRL